jgi:putative transposase
MANGRRVYVPGISVHVRQRGNNRCSIYGDDSDYESFLIMLQSATERYAVNVHGYSLMTTHTHMLLTPTTAHGIPKAMHQLGVRYVLYFNKKYQRVGTLFTGRYKPKPIRDERYWLTCLRYIELNPVRARMVVRPEQYRWSSYSAHALGEGGEWLATHALLEAFGETPAARQAAYRELFETPLSTEQLVRQRLKD